MCAQPDRLDAIIHVDRWGLALARTEEDDRIVRFVASLDAATLLLDTLDYTTTAGKAFAQPRCDILDHLFIED